MKVNGIKQQLPRFVQLVLLFLMCLQGLHAQQAEQSPAIIQNNSNGPIDYYVILTNGGSQYINSLDQGMQITENFYVGEKILITPQGSQDVIAEHVYDGTINAVLAAAPNSQAPSISPPAPPNKRAPQPIPSNPTAGSNTADNASPAAPAEPEKPSYKVSREFKDWLTTDKPYYEERTKNESTYQAGFQEKFRTEDQMRKGYNILKMDPSRLTNRGLRSNAPDLVKKLTGSSFNWGIRELGLAIPNDLVLLPEQGRTRGVEQTTILFSSNQERKSSSVNVGANLDVGKKGSGSGKIGISREESKFESNNQSMIRKQIVGEAYWVVYAKEHMELANGFSKFLRNSNNLKTYADFKRMFDLYGTHWPVATLFGGYIRYDEMFDTKEMSESITKTLSVDIAAKAPVPKAPSATVGGSVGFTQSDTNEMRNKESQGRASFESQGGQPGASFGMWNMATPTAADNYVPLKVELRTIDELIWPELMGIKDPAEATRIHALRVKTGKMLGQYIDEVQGINTTEDWNPRVYEVTMTRAVVSQDDDEGSGNEPDFFGSLIVAEAKKKKIKVSHLTIDTYEKSKVGKNINEKYLWSKSRDDRVTMGKGKTFSLRSDGAIYISVPATPVQSGTVNGKPLYKPSFNLNGIVGYFQSTIKDDDDTGKDEDNSGSFAISLDEVEKSDVKLVSREREFDDEGVGIKVKGQVKRIDYQLQNSEFELLDLPGLARLNQGAAIAAKEVAIRPASSGVSVSRPSYNSGNTKAKKPTTPTSSAAKTKFSGFPRIQNRWFPTHHLHNQNGKLELGSMQPNWWSAQWTIEPVPGAEEWVRIKNRWYPDHGLHNQNGKLELGPIQPNWWSAQWRIVPVPGAPGWVRIQNRWYPDHYIHNQSKSLELGPMQDNWWSAQWAIK